jgi:hypothetical protein
MAGLDRFEERHWQQLEAQLERKRKPASETTPQATTRGGFVTSGTRKVIRSPWME